MCVKKFIFSKFAGLQAYSRQLYYQMNSFTGFFRQHFKPPHAPPMYWSPHQIFWKPSDTIFNIHRKKIFATNFHFLMNSPKPITLLLSVTKVFRWCYLNTENFCFCIWVVLLWLDFLTRMTLRHLLLMLMNKMVLDSKDHQIYSKMLRKICM